MKTAATTKYALLAVGYIAQHKGNNLVLSQDIAKAYDIPLEYLLKIMNQLTKAQPFNS